MHGLVKIIYNFLGTYVRITLLMTLNTVLFYLVFIETLWNGYSLSPFFRQETDVLRGNMIRSGSRLDLESTGDGIQTQDCVILVTCNRHQTPTV